MKKKKILIFSPFYPPHIGGVENYTQELCNHLGDAGIDTIVFTPNIPENSSALENTKNNVTVIRFPAFEIVSNYPLPKFWQIKFWSMFSSLFHESFDITLSHTRFFNTSLMALIYSKIKKIPWLHIEHGSAFVDLSSNITSFLSKIYDLTFGRLVFKASTANISISIAVSEFIKRFDKRKSMVIYRGLNLADIDSSPENINLKNKYSGKLIIVFSGRLYKWKGVENSVRAVSGLPKKIKDNIVFLIVGDGEDFSRIKELSDQTTVMLGSVPREEVFGTLKIADIFIHSALPGGGLSTSLLEAMYCECAIIATPNEGAREVVIDKENGVNIEESNSDLIRNKIIELYNDKEKRQQYAGNAKMTVIESFDWNTNTGKYIKYFEEILNNDKK